MARAYLEPAKPGQIFLDVEYRDRDLVRAVPGSKWVRDRTWRCPCTWAVCLALRGVFGERLDVADDLGEWAWREVETRVRPAQEARDIALDPEASWQGAGAFIEEHAFEPWRGLRGYQQTGVHFLDVARDAVLADDMGLGKTIETIAALELGDSYPALIICPKSVKDNWRTSFETWAPHRTVTVVSAGAGKAKALAADTDVMIVNWDLLRTTSRIAGYGSIRLSEKERVPGPLNREWGAVVADEAHKAKEPENKQTRALWAVGSTARRRLALTGTPVANVPQDLWSLLHFVAPQEWPSRSQFMDRYCLMTVGFWGGVEVLGLRPDTKDEFYAAVDSRLLRRSKELVAKDLPPKTHVVRHTPMVPKQERAYKDMVDSMVTWLDENPLAAFDPLVLATRLRQFAAAYAEIDEEGRVRLTEPSGKVNGLLELLEEMGDDPLVVFAESKQLVDLACQRLEKSHVTYGRITGDENERQRNHARDEFRRGSTRVILLTLGAGSTGLDGLQDRASTVCFLQRGRSAVENSQAEDRLHRIGQTNPVTVVDLVTPGTVEETVVLPSFQQKKDILEEVVRDRDAIRRLLLA